MGAQILIIEDEIIVAQDIKEILLGLGYKIPLIISNSEKAVDYLSFNTPDLVLCDINIKGSRDGIEVAKIVRKIKRIPFVFLTSLSDKDTIERAKHALPYGYIIKPFSEHDLLPAITVALFKFQEEINALKITKEKSDLLALQVLTLKEFEILSSITKGNSYPDICTKLNFSQNTLKYHT